VTEAGIAALADSPHLGRLHSLALLSRRFHPSALARLAISPLARSLRSLQIPYSDQALGEGTRHLAQSPCLSALRRLNLDGCGIGDAGAAHLAASATLRELRHLHLVGNGIGDTGVKALAGSPILANVHTLTLMNNRIGDEGALALARSPYLGRARSLALGNIRLSESVRQALLERFPGVVMV
jgi:hypothetical protein